MTEDEKIWSLQNKVRDMQMQLRNLFERNREQEKIIETLQEKVRMLEKYKL